MLGGDQVGERLTASALFFLDSTSLMEPAARNCIPLPAGDQRRRVRITGRRKLNLAATRKRRRTDEEIDNLASFSPFHTTLHCVFTHCNEIP